MYPPLQQYGMIYRQRMFNLGFSAKETTTIANIMLSLASLVGKFKILPQSNIVYHNLLNFLLFLMLPRHCKWCHVSTLYISAGCHRRQHFDI